VKESRDVVDKEMPRCQDARLTGRLLSWARVASPNLIDRKHRTTRRRTKEKTTNLFAKPLDVELRELLTAHQTLDPSIERGDGRGFEVDEGLGGYTPDIFHSSVHHGEFGDAVGFWFGSGD